LELHIFAVVVFLLRGGFVQYQYRHPRVLGLILFVKQAQSKTKTNKQVNTKQNTGKQAQSKTQTIKQTQSKDKQTSKHKAKH